MNSAFEHNFWVTIFKNSAMEINENGKGENEIETLVKANLVRSFCVFFLRSWDLFWFWIYFLVVKVPNIHFLERRNVILDEPKHHTTN